MINNYEFFEFFILFVIKSSIILLLVLAVSHYMKNASASFQYTIKSVGLIAVILIPIYSYILPSWDVAIVEKVKIEQKEFINNGNNSNETNHVLLEKNVSSKEIVTEKSQSEFSFMNNLDVKSIVLYTWLSIAVILFLRTIIGLLSIWNIARNSKTVDRDDWELLGIRLSNQLELKHNPKVRISDDVYSPMTWGIRRHVLLLPSDAKSWTMDRLEMVLIHELAHIKRGDFFVHILTQFCSALCWFNPLVWKISKHMIDDREKACDDHVVIKAENASDYASHLLDIAKSLTYKSDSAFATVCMAKPNQLEGRLTSILDKNKNRLFNSGKQMMMKLSIFILIVPLAAMQPWVYEENISSPTLNEKIQLSSPESGDDEKEEISLDDKIKKVEKVTEEKEIPKITSNKTTNTITNINSGIASNKKNITYTIQDSLDAIDELIKYKKSGLIKHFNMHDILTFTKNGVSHEQVSSYYTENSKFDYSAHDIMTLLKSNVPSDYIKKLKKSGLINELSAFDITRLYKNNVDIDDLVELNKINIFDHYSAYDITILTKNKVTVDYLKTMNESKILDHFSAYDVTQLWKANITSDDLTKYSNNGMFEYFSAYDLTTFKKNNTDVNYIVEISKMGLLDKYSAYDISRLNKEKVSISDLKRLKENDLLDDFSAYDIITLMKKSKSKDN